MTRHFEQHTCDFTEAGTRHLYKAIYGRRESSSRLNNETIGCCRARRVGNSPSTTIGEKYER